MKGIRYIAMMLSAVAMLFAVSCSKDDSSKSNELVGTTWSGGGEWSGESYNMYLDMTITFSSNTSGTYIQVKNGDARTWSFTYSYSGSTGSVSGAPFSKFTISGNKLKFSPDVTYGGYSIGEQTLTKQ